MFLASARPHVANVIDDLRESARVVRVCLSGMSNSQASMPNQFPSLKIQARIGEHERGAHESRLLLIRHWDLKLGHSLETGVWKLVISF